MCILCPCEGTDTHTLGKVDIEYDILWFFFLLQEPVSKVENEASEGMGRVDEGVEEFFTKKILPDYALWVDLTHKHTPRQTHTDLFSYSYFKWAMGPTVAESLFKSFIILDLIISLHPHDSDLDYDIDKGIQVKPQQAGTSSQPRARCTNDGFVVKDSAVRMETSKKLQTSHVRNFLDKAVSDKMRIKDTYF